MLNSYVMVCGEPQLVTMEFFELFCDELYAALTEEEAIERYGKRRIDIEGGEWNELVFKAYTEFIESWL